MKTLAAWTCDAGTMSIVRQDLGHVSAYWDGRHWRSVNVRPDATDDHAIKTAERMLRWGVFGIQFKDAYREY